MAKIENETNHQVTFSKRRAGLFKKASELSTLCGAESVVFSPGEKAHSFGHPNVETIANRFLNPNAPPRNNTDPLLMACSAATMHQHNQELINIEGQLELEKHHNMRKTSQSQNWCPPRIDELNYEQLDQLKRYIMSFKDIFETKIRNAMSLANPYVQGSNSEAGIGGGAPWTTPSGPSIGFTMDSNIQGPSDDQFALYGYQTPFFPDGSTNPEGGAGNPNVAIPRNPRASSSSVSVFRSFSFVAPFDANVGNFGFTVQYPPMAEASGSDVLLPPYNYGNPSDVVPYGGGTRRSNLEHEGNPMETQTDVQNKFIGFNNYGREN